MTIRPDSSFHRCRPTSKAGSILILSFSVFVIWSAVVSLFVAGASSTWKKERKYHPMRISVAIIVIAIAFLVAAIVMFALEEWTAAWLCSFFTCLSVIYLAVRTSKVWWKKRQFRKALRHVPPTGRRYRSSSYPPRETGPRNDLESFSQRLGASEESLNAVRRRYIATSTEVVEDTDVFQGLVLEQTPAQAVVDSSTAARTDRQAEWWHKTREAPM